MEGRKRSAGYTRLGPNVSRKRRVALAFAVAILSLCIISFLISLIGGIYLAIFPLCDTLQFGTEEPRTIVLPDLHNLSSSEQLSLLEGNYELSTKYNLKLAEDLEDVKLCIIKKYFTRISACIQVGTDMENTWICTPDTRPDCLPSALVDHYFGLSLWKQEEPTVVYNVVDIESSQIYERILTNTTATLSTVWYTMLDCWSYMRLTEAVIVFGILFICCGGCLCLCIISHCCRKKSRRQLQRQTRTAPINMPSYKAFAVSSKESDEELEAGGMSSSGSTCTAVPDRGHGKGGRRSRLVSSTRPMVDTDNSSKSEVATDMSNNDISDESSDDDEAGSHVNSQLSSSSSSMAPRVEEASGMGTPPPFANISLNAVYDHRPGVPTGKRWSPEGM